MKTYQDLQDAKDKAEFVLEAINDHKGSEMYKIAFNAEEYDHRRNVTILRYKKLLYTLKGEAIPDVYTANHKLCNAYFPRFVTQENQYLLGNGVKLDTGKERLGEDFDDRLQEAGRAALVQGVSFGLWDLDRMKVFKLTEFAPLWDENTSVLMAGIRYWQVAADKPLRAVLYEPDGFTEYRKDKDSGISVTVEKRPYIQVTQTSEADGEEIVEGMNYPSLPIVPLWCSPQKQSELVGLRESIDCYDLIKSGFANDLDDASLIYWTLENSGGMDDEDLAQFVERIKTLHAAPADAKAHTFDVPYQSRVAYLERLERDLYNDAQIVNVAELSAAQKTATEIKAAYTPMDLKTDQYEYCVREFLRGIFALAGLDPKTEPEFKRNRIQNELEATQMVMMAAQYLDDETILNKLPWLTPEEVEQAMARRAEIETARFSGNPAGQQLEGVNTDGNAANA